MRRRIHRQTTIFELIQIMLDLMNGYRALYDNDIIHQDIKTANIMIRNRVLKIGDFGLAQRKKYLNHSKVAGTFSYIPPERLRYPPAPITHLVDIYGLGIVLYEVMFGCHPMSGFA